MQYARLGQGVAALHHGGLRLVDQDPLGVNLGRPAPLRHHRHRQVPGGVEAAAIGEGAPQHLQQVGLGEQGAFFLVDPQPLREPSAAIRG